jgi:hypothetical protein
MKSMLILLTVALFFTLKSNGQNFFFIGEKSFPSTEVFTLQSNTEDTYINDLKVLFAKQGTTGFFIVSIKTASTVRICEKLIIYLDDGTVISCDDKGIKDNVDAIASTAYYLTDEDLNKMTRSNINTVRYVLKCAECLSSPVEGNYSASNRGSTRTDFPAIINNFFKIY